MRIVVRHHIPIIVAPRLFLVLRHAFGFDVGAVTIFPFILVRDTTILNNPAYINHESIHLYQHLETFLVGFWIIGALQYLYAILFLKKTRLQAYYYMSHEQEAHQNDENLEYLKTRKWFSYYRYLLPKNRRKMDLVQGKRVIDWG